MHAQRKANLYLGEKKTTQMSIPSKFYHIHFNMSRTAALLLMKIIITFSTVFYDSMLFSYWHILKQTKKKARRTQTCTCLGHCKLRPMDGWACQSGNCPLSGNAELSGCLDGHNWVISIGRGLQLLVPVQIVFLGCCCFLISPSAKKKNKVLKTSNFNCLQMKN